MYSKIWGQILTYNSVTSFSFPANFASSSMASSWQTVESTSKQTASAALHNALVRISAADMLLTLEECLKLTKFEESPFGEIAMEKKYQQSNNSNYIEQQILL